MRSPQHLTSNGPRVRTDKYGSQCSIEYQFARRCFALRASSAALSNHESRTAKSRELPSPALCLRPLGVDKPTRQLTALGGEGEPDSSVITSLHSIPLRSPPGTRAPPPRRETATRHCPQSAVPDARSDSIAFRFVIKTRLAKLSGRTPGQRITSPSSGKRKLASAAAWSCAGLPILACPAVPKPVQASLLPL
jgi:hypothetical protein